MKEIGCWSVVESHETVRTLRSWGIYFTIDFEMHTSKIRHVLKCVEKSVATFQRQAGLSTSSILLRILPVMWKSITKKSTVRQRQKQFFTMRT